MSHEPTFIKIEPELIIDDTASTYSDINENVSILPASDDCLTKIKREQDEQKNLEENYKRKPCKQFKCDTCDKCFDQKAAKNRHHLLVHTSVRPFSCDICKSSFVDKSCVRNHMQQHIQYYCPICGEPFRHAFNIKRHMLVHNGLRPYVCSLCEKTYKHSSHLKRHLKHHENNGSEQDKKTPKRKKRRNSKVPKRNTSITVK